MGSSKELVANTNSGNPRVIEDHDHDLVYELSRRVDSFSRYDLYLSNAENLPELQALWRDLKAQEQRNIAQIKQLMIRHVQSNCF